MPVRTITAEIDGTPRQIRADIPDGATQDDILGAVQSWVESQPRVPGMEKLGMLPPVPPSRFKELEGPPAAPRVAGGRANLPPRNPLERAADILTFGGTRKFREGLEELAPEAGTAGTEQRLRGARHMLEGGMAAMTPKAFGAALETLGAAPTLIRGLIAVARPYLLGAAAGAATDVGSQILGASPETGALAGEVAGVATGVGAGAGRKQEVKPAAEGGGRLPSIPGPLRLVLRAKGLGKVIDAYEMFRSAGKTVADVEKVAPYAPKPGVARKMPYGGSYSPEIEAPSYRQAPRTPAPVKYGTPAAAAAAKPVPKAPEPFRPNPRVAARMRYGGPMEEHGGPSYRRAGRPATPAAPAAPAASTAESTGSTSTKEGGGGSDIGDIPESHRKYAIETAKKIAQHREGRVQGIVSLARSAGITPDKLAKATPEERKMLARAIDPKYKDISDETLRLAVEALRKPQVTPPIPPSKLEQSGVE